MENDSKKIPPFLQGVLWSTKIDELNLESDRVYVINQILSYGTLPMINWLFQTYPKRTIHDIFLRHPIKDYPASRFHFVKNFLLGLDKTRLNQNRYVKNSPRNLR